MAYQFLHIETYSEASKKVHGTEDHYNCAAQVLGEAMRLPEYCKHVENPRKVISLGGTMSVRQLQERRAAILTNLRETVTRKDGTTYTRKLRREAATLYTEIHSHPLPADELLKDKQAHAPAIKEWIDRALTDFKTRMPDGVDWSAVMHLDDRKGRNSDYIVGVVNGLLEHLTRLNDKPGVVVLGATNYPDMIDPAITRPGRFDLKLDLSTPDRTSVLQILTHALGSDANAMPLDPIADQILGLSGAQITALVREAQGLARSEQCPLNRSHLEAAATGICPFLDEGLLWRIAVHEAGHIVVAHVLGLPPAERATITITGGFVDIPSPMLESALTAKNRIAALLGGRAAEQGILGEALNGAGIGQNSDLKLATRLAAQMLFEWGLGDQLAFTPPPARIKDRTKHLDNILKDAEQSAIQILTTKKELIAKIAATLCKKRELSGEQIRALLP